MAQCSSGPSFHQNCPCLVTGLCQEPLWEKAEREEAEAGNKDLSRNEYPDLLCAADCELLGDHEPGDSPHLVKCP